MGGVRIKTIWGKISDGYLYSNVGKIRPKNIYRYLDNTEGWFRFRSDHNVIEFVYFDNPSPRLTR